MTKASGYLTLLSTDDTKFNIFLETWKRKELFLMKYSNEYAACHGWGPSESPASALT